MAGAKPKFRHLSRKTSHRQALLRNLVTSLFTHEAISTTWPKAKEAQRLAEKLITLGKRNTIAARNKAQSIFYTPHLLLPKLFGPLRQRYAARPGGYTRVLRMEPMKDDAAPSAILELLDGPKDMRFAMTARTLATQWKGQDPSVASVEKSEKGDLLENAPRQERSAGGRGVMPLTLENARKVTRYRKNGEKELMAMVEKFRVLDVGRGRNTEDDDVRSLR
ncbi:MAG: hypothetical protein M4579_004574 [Chaenotheca gracillima]|nr:MAG: hypothetical protein M4579_004574 [Chaenotheca gracillima]